jgi:sugar/nucleoside kinase (ribokinase family)
MSVDHFNIKCAGGGCERTIAVHLALFSDLGLLGGMVRDFGWRLIDAMARDPNDPVNEIVTFLCIDCARKALPADVVADMDKDEAERRSTMS